MTEQEKIRREKLEELKKLGIDPYPAELYPVTNYSKDLISKYEDKKQVVIAGRIMSRRIQGNASFAEILDSKGRIQVYFNDKKLRNFGPLWFCGVLMPIGLWVGLIVSLFFGFVCFWGFSMLANIQTMDRFDDPKGKQIYVPQTD